MLASLERLLDSALARGFAEAEVYAVHFASRQFSVSGDRIVHSVACEDYDIGLRGSIGRRVGSVRTNNLNVDVGWLVERLHSATMASPEDPYWSGFPANTRGVNPVNCYDAKTASTSDEELVDVLAYVMDAFKSSALKRGANRASVVEGVLAVRESEVFVANSHGVNRSTRCTAVSTWLTLSVEKGGLSADKLLVYEKRKLDIEELVGKASREGELALSFFNASRVESGHYDVILVPAVAGEILAYSIAPAFSALNIVENRSPLRGKLGEPVVSSKITIVDDPSVEVATGSRPFDDEGIATSTKPVVYKGVFKTMLQSFYTAKRTGGEPTGNAFRQHPAAPPTPHFTNLVIEPVHGSLEEFAQETGRGIVVYEVIGHWMSDPVTGNVKATVTHGLLVERGVVKKPVKGVVIAGNIYDWLYGNLVEVGKDAEAIGSTVTPSFFIRNVSVAGD